MLRMVGRADAGDVAQQVFLQALRRIGQFDGRARFETWLYRIAVNESLQHLRRRRRWKRGQSLETEPLDASPPHDEQVECKELVDRALARLEPELRSLFWLREVEGMSYREIALSLDIPEGTVGSRLNRVRQELQRHLKDLGWGP